MGLKHRLMGGPRDFAHLASVFVLYLLLVSVLFPPSMVRAEGSPRIGLVLSGGGARGVAHVGVLKALEEMRVPVHAIAATSMGALVGGLYASGLSSTDLEEILANIDWSEAFRDRPDREDRPMRRKEEDYDSAAKLRLSFKNGKLRLPLGAIQGQRANLLIKDFAVRAELIRDFDQLPIPYRALAADVETGEAYVFAEGDIALAMRTSMSLPGVYAPVKHDGRLLVDGGIANNLPIDVARAMGVDRVIAVDIGTPLLDVDNITSVLAVTGQMVTLLTRRNTVEQLETLNDDDILITPALDEIGTLGFDKYELAFERGYQATRALADRLLALSVDDSQWNRYLARRDIDHEREPVVDRIVLRNDSRIDDRLIEVRLRQPLGQALDRAQLEEDIQQIYGLDYFESVDYEIVPEEGQTTLLVKLREKSWGTDNLRLGAGLVSDLNGDSRYNMSVQYRQSGINRLGAEWGGRAQIGDTIILDLEFYQPLDPVARFYVEPYVRYLDYEVLTFGPERDFRQPIGAWRVRRGDLGADVGVNLPLASRIKGGLFRGYGSYRVDTGSPELGSDDFNEAGVLFGFLHDSLDNAYFPTRGVNVLADYERNVSALGADQDFSRWRIWGQGAFSFGQDDANTVILGLRTSQSIGSAAEPQNFFMLGGLFNLSGLNENALSGRQMRFGIAQYQRRLTEQTLIPISSPLYAGFSLEAGNLWAERSDVDLGDLLVAGSLYAAIDTFLGPVYVAYGRTESLRQAIYFSLGWPFFGQSTFNH